MYLHLLSDESILKLSYHVFHIYISINQEEYQLYSPLKSVELREGETILMILIILSYPYNYILIMTD